MSIALKIEVITFCIFTILLMIYIVRNGRISIKYSLVWLFSMAILLIAALIPNFMESIANILGFEVLSNMIFAMIILILMFVSISLTIIVSGQNEKIKLIIQELSMLKERTK